MEFEVEMPHGPLVDCGITKNQLNIFALERNSQYPNTNHLVLQIEILRNT